MSLADDLASDVQEVIDTRWKTRKGQKVPETTEIALAGGAVELDATFLYADLADSSKMAKELDRRVAAKIFKAFLATTSRLIRKHGGTIVSFDGDRILGVFVGTAMNSSAANVGLKINHTVSKIIRPKFEQKYESVRNASFTIRQGVGIDTGTVLAVRAGARGDSDLVWVGRAPNLAAKLSDLRESPYHTFLTSTVYNRLNSTAKYGGQDAKNMWERRPWNFLGEQMTIYRSNWRRKP